MKSDRENTKSIDFDRVAHWYDAYVTTEADIPFWVDEARAHPEPRLELMCGTGRISLGILRAGMKLDCVDYSAGMLRRFREKLGREGLRADLFHEDIGATRLPGGYGWIFLGFHSIAELESLEKQETALKNIYRLLRSGGRFTCSLQNPITRSAQLDGRIHSFGQNVLENGNRLSVSGMYRYDPVSTRVTGEQTYRETTPAGDLTSDLVLPVKFILTDHETILGLAKSCGFELEESWGDYLRAPLDPKRSDFLIYRFIRRR